MNRQRDLIIIGGGAAGLVVASVAAQLGQDVLLIEKLPEMGGDCLHFGCVPSKALLHVAKVAHIMRQAHQLGFQPVQPEITMSDVNAAIRQAIDSIQVHDSHERFQSLGCETLTGTASFVNGNTIEVESVSQETASVDTQTYTARRFVIATGSSSFIPTISGLELVKYLTNEDMFSLPILPKRLLVLGGGPVGIEMSQAFSRLGSDVTLLELAERILPRMDKELTDVIEQTLTKEGVNLITGAEIVRVNESVDAEKSMGEKTVYLKNGESFSGDEILLAIGRRPVVKGLNLEAGGVDYTSSGVTVNRKMQTTNKRIYACGDVTGEMPLTHVAELQAGIVIANILFRIPKKISYQVVPSVVYSSPECAQVGMSIDEAEKNNDIEILRFDYAELDRAVAEHSTDGVAKLIVRKGRIVGAHIVGERAGDIIHELALAILEKMKVSKITSLVHAYPSYAQMNKRLAGQYYKDRLFSKNTRRLVKFLTKF